MIPTKNSFKFQSSFELLITLSFGLAILIPVIVIAFIQIANANTSLSAIETAQAASKLSSVATVVGNEGFPARQLVQINVPSGVINIFTGNTMDGIGHEIIFEVVSPINASYIPTYTPVNVSGNLSSISSPGTYLINVSAQVQCPSDTQYECVYMRPVV